MLNSNQSLFPADNSSSKTQIATDNCVRSNLNEIRFITYSGIVSIVSEAPTQTKEQKLFQPSRNDAFSGDAIYNSNLFLVKSDSPYSIIISLHQVLLWCRRQILTAEENKLWEYKQFSLSSPLPVSFILNECIFAFATKKKKFFFSIHLWLQPSSSRAFRLDALYENEKEMN